MKIVLSLLLTACAAIVGRAADAPVVAKVGKSVVEYRLCVPSGPWIHGWSLRHFEALNGALDRFLSHERPGNTKCLVVPQTVGYAVVWIRSDWEEPITAAQKKRAEEIIDSYLFGEDCARISSEEKETKAPEATPGQRPSAEPSPPSGAPQL